MLFFTIHKLNVAFNCHADEGQHLPLTGNKIYSDADLRQHDLTLL